MTNCVRFRVHGRVQGVGFRAHCRRIALDHQLSGWAINRDNGSVDILLVGAASKVAAAKALIVAGPAGAKVERDEACEVPAERPQTGFLIG